MRKLNKTKTVTLVATVVAAGVFCCNTLPDFAIAQVCVAEQDAERAVASDVLPYPFDDPDRLVYVSAHTAWALPVRCGDKRKVFYVDASAPIVRGVSAATRAEAAQSVAYVEGLGWEQSVAVGCVLGKVMTEIEAWVSAELDRAPVDATVVAGSPIAFTQEQDGAQVDRTAMYGAIAHALTHGGEVRLTVTPVRARVTKEGLRRTVTRLSSFSTSVASSTPDRKHNVALAMRAFAFYPIAPGECVSFNAVVGARTAERGYRGAKVILDGEYVDGVGGGVCQASTTVYNAVLLAGMRVDRVSQHSIAPGYVAPSRDAMVSEGVSDLVWSNPTQRTVWLVTQCTPDTVTASVYGADDGTRIRLESVVTATTPPPEAETVVDDGSYGAYFAKGEQSAVVRLPHDGVESELYLIRTNADGTVTRKRIRKNKYRPVRAKVVLRRIGEQGQADADKLLHISRIHPIVLDEIAFVGYT